VADPDIFQYLDYRAWIRDWLAARAGRPSLRGFARRAHCSPSLVSAITKGQRDLDTGRAETFAAAMKLDDAQRSHFVALVAMAHDPSRERRQRALDEVLTTRRFRGARRLTEAAFTILSDPEVAAVFELARCDGWRADPEWIARSMIPPISVDAADRAIDALSTAGILVPDEHGHLVMPSREWATDHDVTNDLVNLAVDRLHRRILSRTAQVLDSIPYPERHFAALTFCIPEKSVPELKARLTRFYEEMMNLVETTGAPADRVYRLCAQLYPVARTSKD
jgi:uncharacterized protein (TIGR02147 family)